MIALTRIMTARKKSLAAAAMLTCSVKTRDLKMLSKCKKNPKKMFDLIYSKYGKRRTVT